MPSAIACAQASASRPAMPAPCVIDRDGAAALPSGVARNVRREVADLVDVELVGLAEAGDDHARRRELAERVDQRQLVLLAAAVAVGDEARDRAVQRPVDGAGAAAGAGDAFEQVDDDRVQPATGRCRHSPPGCPCEVLSR